MGDEKYKKQNKEFECIGCKSFYLREKSYREGYEVVEDIPLQGPWLPLEPKNLSQLLKILENHKKTLDEMVEAQKPTKKEQT